MKEILLYSYMYDFMIAEIIKEINAANGQEITLRVNTPGGDVLDSYGLVAKLKEQKTEPSIIVDGKANSMGAFLCCYFKKVKGLDVSEWTFHRAAYSNWFESNPMYYTEDARASLVKTNADLRAAMESKIKASDWKKITGVSLDDLFSMDTRIDVTINADQAFKLGLIDEIIPITPERRAQIERNAYSIAATTMMIPKTAEKPQESKPSTENLTPNTTMTIEKLKAEHPEIYAAAVKVGVMQERDRVGSYMAYHDVDPVAVATGIKNGDVLSATSMAEFSRKAFSKDALKTAEDGNAAAVTTAETPAGQEKPGAKATKEFVDASRKRLNIAVGS